MPFEPRVDPVPPYLPVPVDPSGLRGPTKSQAAGRHWRRAGPRRYVPVTVDGSRVSQRIAEAATRLDSRGAVTGWAGLHLAGGAYFDGLLNGCELPVMLALGHSSGRRAAAGVNLSYEPVHPDEIHVVHGIPVLPPARCLFDEMRRLDSWRLAVVALDMALAARLTSLRRMQSFAQERSTWKRSRRVTAALALGNEHARSPRETLLRLLWTVDAGLPPPLVNRTVRTRSGAFVCVPDLFDDVAGLVIEYNGVDHRGMRSQGLDARRFERCRDVRLEYCMVTALDMADETEVVSRLVAARRRSLFLPAEQTLWTIAPVEGPTLDERLDLCEQSASDAWQRWGLRRLPW